MLKSLQLSDIHPTLSLHPHPVIGVFVVAQSVGHDAADSFESQIPFPHIAVHALSGGVVAPHVPLH